MNNDFGTPVAPLNEPPKRNNRTLIIVVVLLVLLCCCVGGAGLLYWLWEYGGDMILEMMGAIP
jgi:hypothetical protein